MVYFLQRTIYICIQGYIFPTEEYRHFRIIANLKSIRVVKPMPVGVRGLPREKANYTIVQDLMSVPCRGPISCCTGPRGEPISHFRNCRPPTSSVVNRALKWIGTPGVARKGRRPWNSFLSENPLPNKQHAFGTNSCEQTVL